MVVRRYEPGEEYGEPAMLPSDTGGWVGYLEVELLERRLMDLCGVVNALVAAGDSVLCEADPLCHADNHPESSIGRADREWQEVRERAVDMARSIERDYECGMLPPKNGRHPLDR